MIVDIRSAREAKTELRPTETKTYGKPEIHAVGKSLDLVQGGGGLSGLDRNAYYWFLPGEY